MIIGGILVHVFHIRLCHGRSRSGNLGQILIGLGKICNHQLCNHSMTLIGRMHPVSSKFCPRKSAVFHFRPHCVTVTNLRQIVVQTNGNLLRLRIASAFIHHVQLHHRRLGRIGQDTMHQVGVRLGLHSVITVVDTEFHNHKIGIILQQIFLHAVHTKQAGSAAVTSLYKIKLRFRESFLPPSKTQSCIAGLVIIGCVCTLGHATTDIADGNLLAFQRTAHHVGKTGAIALRYQCMLQHHRSDTQILCIIGKGHIVEGAIDVIVATAALSALQEFTDPQGRQIRHRLIESNKG